MNKRSDIVNIGGFSKPVLDSILNVFNLKAAIKSRAIERIDEFIMILNINKKHVERNYLGIQRVMSLRV